MAKAYTTSTASVKVPVIVSFTCPKCAQRGSVNKTALLSASVTTRGYNSSGASFAAQQNLAATANNQVDLIVESLEKGHLNVLLDEQGRNVNGKVVCPHCGTRQIVDVDGKPKTLYPKLFALKLVGLFFGVAFACGLVIALTKQTQVSSGLVSITELVCIAAIAAAFVVNSAKSRKAYDDPALMEKRYRCVLNPHLEALLMPGLGNTRRVDIYGKNPKDA